jgi:hypothetical protein
MIYKILQSDNIIGLTNSVNKYLYLGWKLQGGESVCYYDFHPDSGKRGFSYVQAVKSDSNVDYIKDDDE